VDIDTFLSINKNGETNAVLTYVSNPGFSDFGRGFGADEPWPFPVTETDFQSRSVLFPSTEVTGYKIKRKKDGSEIITVKLKSDSAESLSEYLGMKISLKNPDKKGSGSFLLELPAPYSTLMDTDNDDLNKLSDMAGDSFISFSIRVPYGIREVSNGSYKGKTASVSFYLSEYLENKKSFNWKVNW
jgi:hypothetical protein